MVTTYDLKQERKVASFMTHNGYLSGMTQRKDLSKELVTAGHGSPITFWSQQFGVAKPSSKIDFPYRVLCIESSPNGKFIAYGTETNELFVYAVNQPGQSPSFVAKGLGHSAPITKLRWTPDSR